MLCVIYIYTVTISNIQQSSIELWKGTETRETNSNVAKDERNGIRNMTRRLQSLTREICKFNDKSHVTICPQSSIDFVGSCNMFNPHWRSGKVRCFVLGGLWAQAPRLILQNWQTC